MILKRYNIATLLFFSSICIGVIITLLLPDVNSNYEFSKINIDFHYIISTLQSIFINNILVFLLSFFLVRLFIYFKNKLKKGKAKYGKYDKWLYHLINAEILIKTGITLGYSLISIHNMTNVPLPILLFCGIIPHGVLEMIPFIVAFTLNYELIQKQQWNQSLFFSKSKLSLLCFFILIASFIESIVTPYLLNLYV